MKLTGIRLFRCWKEFARTKRKGFVLFCLQQPNDYILIQSNNPILRVMYNNYIKHKIRLHNGLV